MRALWAKLTGAVSDQRGYTLTELLVGMVIALMVAAGALGLVQLAIRTQPATSDKAAQIQEGRVMIERLARELRQGESVSNQSATGLQVVTYVNRATCGGAGSNHAILCRVTYACSATACTRTEANPSAGSTPSSPEEVVHGISGSSVFSYQFQAGQSAPSFVGIRLAFANQDGQETVTLDDGVSLRNDFEGS